MEQKKSGALFPVSGGILLFTLIFGALFVTQKPFHVKRTSGILKCPEHSQGTGVPARLWQDPFAAVEQAALESKSHPSYPLEGHRPMNLRICVSRILGEGYSVDVAGIWVWGGPRAESVEWRIRCRYAALSALGAIGFRPDDASHVGYVLYTPARFLKPLPHSPDPLPSHKHDSPHKVPVPYEWFTAGGHERRKVLLLWLDTEAFPGSAMDDICRLRGGIMPDGADNTRFMLIGPGSSNDLRSMISWAQSISQQDRQSRQYSLENTMIYSPFATVDYSAGSIKSVLPDSSGDPARLFQQAAGIRFVRTIHEDGELAEAMRRELMRRGINPAKDRIALVSEWDSIYASELMDTFQQVFNSSGGTYSDHERHIFRYCYMRGLDGVVPGNAASLTVSSTKKSDSNGKNSDHNTKAIEKPVGQSQYDYLRRMGKVLAREENLRAVGVLGSDVYDKLLVLEALHDLLPDVIFFTTDLDARYFHPAYSKWSRNLLVVSSLGLELARRYQKTIPPFRSVYQTSLFLTLQKALEFNGASPDQRDFDLMLNQPRIFETGIGEAYDISINDPRHKLFSVQPPVYHSTWLQRNTTVMMWLTLLLFLLPPIYLLFDSIIDVQALFGDREEFTGVVSRAFKAFLRGGTGGRRNISSFNIQNEEPLPSIPWKFWAASIFVLCGFMILKCCLTSDIYRSQGWLAKSTVYIFISFCIISFPLFFLMSAQLLKPDRYQARIYQDSVQSEQGIGGVPFFRFNPTPLPWKFWIGMALSTILTGLLLYIVVSRQVTGGEPFVLTGGISIWPSTFLLFFAGILAIFLLYHASFSLQTNISSIPGRFCARCSLKGGAAHKCLNTDWHNYVRRCTPSLRLWRVFVLWLGYFIAAWLMVRLDRPFIPFRGQAAFIMNSAAVAISVLPMLFLVLWVADTTKMCSRLADDMLEGRSENNRWCSHMSAGKGYVPVNSPGISGSWFNIFLIAHHSEAIVHLVYFPMMVIIVMLIARLSYFDRTDTPLGLAMVIAVTMMHAIIWPARLRIAAERFRRQVLDEFHQALIMAKGRKDDVEAGQLGEMIEYVKALDRGAFRPFSQQPWVHVVLTMFGGGGGYTILTYLNMQ